MILKKITAVLLALLITLLNTVPIFAAEEKEIMLADSENVAEARFGKKLQQVNFGEITSAADDGVGGLRGGEECWVLTKSAPYIYIDMSEEFGNSEIDGSVYDIEVEYYSEGDGFFEIRYDGRSELIPVGKTVEVGNERLWKTVKLVTDKAHFDNRLVKKGYNLVTVPSDIIIAACNEGETNQHFANTKYSTNDVYIKSVRVTRHVAAKPITLNAVTGEAGNIYEWYRDDKNIINKFKNTLDSDVEADVTYKVTDLYGKTRVEKTDRLSLKAGEEKEVVFNVNTDYCSIYKYHVEVSAPDNELNYSFEPFTFAIVKTAEDGVQNEEHYWNAHLLRYVGQSFYDGLDVIKKSNSYGIRSDIVWRFWEYETGSFTYAYNYDLPGTDMLDGYRDAGVHLYAILAPQSNDEIGVKQGQKGAPMTSPQPWTEDQIERYSNFIKKLEDGYGDIITGYELINEPELSGYGKTSGGSEDAYLQVCKDMYTAIRKAGSDKKIWSMSLSNMDGSYVKNEFFPNLISKGILDYSDGISAHAYRFWQPYEDQKAYDSMNYYIKKIEELTGRTDVRFIQTEAGNTTGDWTTATQEARASWAVRGPLVYRAWDFGEFMTYNLEAKGAREKNREDAYGHAGPGSVNIVIEDETRYIPREGYMGITAMNYLMADTDFIKYDALFDNQTWVYQVQTKERFDNQKIAGIWNVALGGSNSVMTFDFGVNEVTMYDFFGNEEKLYSENGEYTFNVSNTPFYIMGHFDDVKCVTENPSYSADVLTAAKGDMIYVDEEFAGDAGNVSLEIEAPDFLTVLEKSNFADGKATATLQLDNSFDGASKFKIKVKDGEKTLQCKEVGFDVGDTITSDISNTQSVVGAYNRWTLDFEISNLSNKNIAEGEVRVNSPEMFKGVKASIGRVLCGKTSKISVNCPKVEVKKLYEIDYDVILKSGEIYNFTKTLDFTVAAEKKGNIVIDGKIGDGEWNTDTAMVCNSAESVKQITDWGGKKDLSASTMIQWDAENMYLFANVTDNIHRNIEAANRLWAGDSVQFGVFYNQNAHIAMGQGNENFNEIGIALLEDGPAVYKYKDQDNRAEAIGIIKNCEVAVLREGNNTKYEFKIPWKELFGKDLTFDVGSEIGYSILYNDDDGLGRRGWMEYASGIGVAKNVDLFTYLKFVE